MKRLFTLLIALGCLSALTAQESTVWREVTLTAAGQLEELVKDDLLGIDSLVVHGPVNDADFTTMWKGTFYGRLSAINLKDADVADDRIPDNAFFRPDSQTDAATDNIKACRLRNIIFPERLSRIGERAFEYAVNLRSITLPTSLRKIDRGAFHYCVNLDMHPLVVRGNFPEIGIQAFAECRKLSHVVFAEGTAKIGSLAFYNTGLTDIVFPESSDFFPAPLWPRTEIDSHAFLGTQVEEITITDNCVFVGEGYFSGCHRLRRASLPEGMETIPQSMFEDCHILDRVDIPSSVKTIENAAFRNTSVVIRDLHEGLEVIGEEAFAGCRYDDILVIPSTVTQLGPYCFLDCGMVSAIYSLSATPPYCGSMGAPRSPFGRVSNSDTHALSDVPLHVPVGCGDAYREADGWYTFRNIIEDPDIPVSGIIGVTAGSTAESDAPVYDLTGRKIAAPAEGQLYIKGGRKYVHRE